MYHYESIGLPNVWLVDGYEEIDTPYGKAVSIHDLLELHRTIASQLVQVQRPLTGAELRFLRKELGLTQEAVGDYLGKNVQSIAIWEKHSTKAALVADRLLRLLFIEQERGNAPVRELLDRLRASAKLPVKTESRTIFTHQNDHWASAA
jgi:DNA-binding transcriptional regulator YiaG